jgi:hemolysin D
MVRINNVPPQNGAAHNGNGNGDGVLTTQPTRQLNQFDKPVILRQAPHWSRAVIWGIVGVTVATIGWACLAKFEEAVPAQGKLEPKGVVQPVKAPVGGVIDDVFVEEGAAVEAGDVLVTFDPQATRAQITSLESIREKLNAENSYYRAQLADQTEVSAPVEIAPALPNSPATGQLWWPRITCIRLSWRGMRPVKPCLPLSGQGCAPQPKK